MSTEIFLTILMLIFSAFFSGIEIAFVSANKLKIELKSIQGSWAGKVLSNFVKRTPKVITAILIGNNLALVIYGIYFGRLLTRIIDQQSGLDPEQDEYLLLVIQTIISTIVILIFGEYLPKAIFRLNPDTTIMSFAWLLRLFYVVFAPFVALINGISWLFITKILRQTYEEKDVGIGKKDLYMFIRESLTDNGNPSHDIDAEMFTNALDFNTIKAWECMVPRTEIEAVSVDSPVSDLIDKFIETEHSKIIIYRESLDQVTGYVHSSAMFEDPKTIEEVMQPVLIVPESMAANVLLSEFTRNRKTLAIVVDEFGGTAGMVTIEDLVEEVFGEIEDEHDEPEEELLEKQIDEKTWLLSARHEVDYINETYNLDLPEGDYSTLSGLVMFAAETIPDVNETVMLKNYRITVVDASENKINSVKVEKLSED